MSSPNPQEKPPVVEYPPLDTIHNYGKQQAQPEQAEPKSELDVLQEQIIGELVKNVGVLVNYALQNLHHFIIDDRDKAHPKIANVEAFNLLRQISARRAVPGSNKVPAPTSDELCDVMEIFVSNGRISYPEVDRMIKELPTPIRIIINAALGAVQNLLASHPEYVNELATQREEMILQMLYQTQETMEAYRLLSVRPYLLRFMTEYTFVQLGVPMDRKPISTERLRAAKPEFGYQRLYDPTGYQAMQDKIRKQAAQAQKKNLKASKTGT